jgi:2'-5' RNA ligase
MASIRAFVAIDLDAPSRRAATALQQQLRAAPDSDRVRWVRPEGLHVTLRFLGQIDLPQVDVVARHVGRETASCAPFSMTLGPARAFPTSRRPRVVTVDLGPAGPLGELAAAVERGVVAAGFEPEERPFRAHLTLGRLRSGLAPDLGDAPAVGASSTVSEIVLFQSQLGSGGSRYTSLARMPLADGPQGGPDDAEGSPRTNP